MPLIRWKMVGTSSRWISFVLRDFETSNERTSSINNCRNWKSGFCFRVKLITKVELFYMERDGNSYWSKWFLAIDIDGRSLKNCLFHHSWINNWVLHIYYRSITETEIFHVDYGRNFHLWKWFAILESDIKNLEKNVVVCQLSNE